MIPFAALGLARGRRLRDAGAGGIFAARGTGELFAGSGWGKGYPGLRITNGRRRPVVDAIMGRMNREQLLHKLDIAWTALRSSYDGLSDAQLTESGVVEEWSVKDILAHVTIWEEEALTHLPVVMAGGRPPRYAAQGGIDAFNARKTAEKRDLSLATVLEQHEETHRRLIAFLATAPEELFTRETRFRHRLRLDTYSHYPIHTAAIRAWRARTYSESGENARAPSGA